MMFERISKFEQVKTAVFPVGGLGTRFLPATKAMPKEMLPVVDKPLIQYAVEEARAAGIKEIIFVTGRGKAAIEDHFDLSTELDNILRQRDRDDLVDELHAIAGPPGSIAYLRQQTPLGLGHAVWSARRLVGNRPFAVLLADDLIHGSKPCLKQMLEAYDEVGGNMVAAMTVPAEHTHRYGIVDPAGHHGRLTRVAGLVEKPKADAPSRTAVIGRYILQPEIMNILGAQEAGSGGEIQLTDAIAKIIGTQPVHAFHFEGQRFDCGDKAGHICANIALAMERPDLRDQVRAMMADMKIAL
jgi:UTP--glucose-1-phosphate uridylyltransferase